jgi:hypothetical protein
MTHINNKMATSEKTDNSAESKLNRYYRLFSDTCYLAPTSLQEETLAAAERIHATTMGWRPTPATEEEIAEVMEATLAHCEKLKSVYPYYKATWDGTTAHLQRSPEHLLLTEGLPVLVIIEIANESDAHADLVVRLELGDQPAAATVCVAPGAQLPVLIQAVTTSGNAASATLKIYPEGGNSEPDPLAINLKTQKPCVIKGRALRSETNEPFPSRVYAKGADNIFRHASKYAGNTTLTEKPVVFRPASLKVPFSYTEGTFEILMPPGEIELTLERGYETPIEKKTVIGKPGETIEVTLESDRAIDMMAKGWISGDTHIHWVINAWNENEDLDLLAMVQRAEDIRVANNLTLYQYQPNGAEFTKPDHFPMGPVPGMCDGEYHVEMGEEFRNDNHYGHINLLNLEQLIEPISTGPGSGGPSGAFDYPQNKSIIEQAHAQGGISIEAHNLGPFHASGVPVNVIHGLSDSLDQIDPIHYYSFLNAGFHIGLSNGSDHPARLSGSCRVYVRSGTSIDYDAWAEAISQAKTFTSSGPLLLLTVNDAEIGDKVDVKKGDLLKVKAWCWSRHPIGNIQIISNGEIVASAKVSENEYELPYETEINESQWFVARCSQSNQYNALNELNVAHTSAIYTEVDKKPVLKSKSIQFWINNIRIHRERLISQGNFEKPEHKEEALAYIDSGIQRFEALLERAN